METSQLAWRPGRHSPHVLYSLKTDKLPEKIGVLNVKSITDPGKTREGDLRGLRRQGKIATSVEWSFFSSSSPLPSAQEFRTFWLGWVFWKELEESASARSVTWVFGWNMWESLLLLGLTDQLTCGNWIASKSTASTEPHHTVSDGKILQGCFLSEIGCTVVDLVSRTGKRVKFVGLENYGLTKSMVKPDVAETLLSVTIKTVLDWFRLVRNLKLGTLQTTAASQGWAYFRRHCMNVPIEVHPYDKPLKMERSSYHGGRAEAFRIGKLPGMVYHYDVNSMYTFLAQHSTFPTKFIRYYGESEKLDISVIPIKQTFFVDCSLNLKVPYFPYKSGGKLVYPIGRFRTVLADAEFRVAVNKRCIDRVHAVAVYEADYVFRTFAINHVENQAKLDGLNLSHLRGPLKLLGNCTYGKPAQHGKAWVGDPERPNYLPWEEWYEDRPDGMDVTRWRAVDGAVAWLDDRHENTESTPGLASTMTSLGRVMLLTILNQIRRGKVYYCDTDSVFCDETASAELENAGLVDSTRLGALKLKEFSEDVEIFGIKFYRFGDRWCVAGMPADAVGIGKDAAHWSAQEGLNAPLWRKHAPEPVSVRRVREMRGDYSHGMVQRTTGLVHPWAIDEPSGWTSLESHGYIPTGDLLTRGQ